MRTISNIYVTFTSLLSFVLHFKPSMTASDFSAVYHLPDVVVYNKYPVYYKNQPGYHRDASAFWVYGNDRPEMANETILQRTPDTGLGYETPQGTTVRMLEPISSSSYRRVAYSLPVDTFSITGSYRLTFLKEIVVSYGKESGGSSYQPPKSATSNGQRQHLAIDMIKMPVESSLKPENLSKTVDLDESVVIRLVPNTDTYNQNLPVIWRRNGEIIEEWGETYLLIHSVASSDAGVYEFYQSEDDRKIGRIGLMKLIVRSCHEGFWGESCSFTCPICYNGGVCDDASGTCICPPGFKGQNCESYCPATWFGQTCESRCFVHFSGDVLCSMMYFCLQDPFGCTCHGYSGIKCIDRCSDGYFGPDCSQKCNCDGGKACNPDTGQCPGDFCAIGYKGPNCQQSTGAKISQFYNTRTNPAGATRFICSIESSERIYQTSVALKSPSGETYLSSTESRLTGTGTTLYPQNFFFDLTHSIDGIYHCLLSDKRIASASILYYDIPKLSTAPRVLQVGKTYVRFQWKKWVRFKDYGDGPLVSYLVYQVFSGSELLIDSVPGQLKTPEITVSGLQPFSFYSFYVKVSRPGVNGIGQPSELVNVTTKCDVQNFVPSKLRVTKSSENEVEIVWNREPCNEDELFIKSYNFQFSLGESFFPSQMVESGVARCQDSLVSKQLRQVGICTRDDPRIRKQGLKAFTRYFFRVRTLLSNSQTGQWSKILAFQTAESPPSIPRDLQVVCSDDTILRLSWQAPAEPRGVVSSYEVRYLEQKKETLFSQSHSDQHFLSEKELSQVVTKKLLNDKDPDVQAYNVPTKEVENESGCFYDIKDLKKNTTYFFQIRAQNGGGRGNWSSILKSSTVSEPCPKPGKKNMANLYAPDAKVAIVSAVLVGVVITLTLVVVMIIGLCSKRSGEIKRQQHARYHQIHRSNLTDNNTTTDARKNKNGSLLSNANATSAETELNSQGTMRLSRHNQETDSICHEHDETPANTLQQPMPHCNGGGVSIENIGGHGTSNHPGSRSGHPTTRSNRSMGSNAEYSTLGSRMSTFSNRGGPNYAQNPAMTMTLNKKATQGYQRRQEAANDSQDYWTQQEIPTHTRSKNGLADTSFINSKMEEDQRTASQHDDSNTSSIQSEPIGHVSGMFLGGAADGNEEGSAKRQTKFASAQQQPHSHNYATLNSNNVPSPTGFIFPLYPCNMPLAAPAHEHSLSISDEASSNCSSTLTDNLTTHSTRLKSSPPPVVVEHLSEGVGSRSPVPVHLHTHGGTPRDPHGTTSPIMARNSTAVTSTVGSVRPGLTGEARGPSAALSTGGGPASDTAAASTIMRMGCAASSTNHSKCFSSSNESSSSSSNSTSHHVHDSHACSSCFQSPWQYRRDLNPQVVLRGSGLA